MHVVFPRKANTAMHLNGFARHGFAHIATIRLGHGNGLASLVHVFVNCPGRVLGQRTRIFDLHHHIYAFMFNGLKAADRFAKLYTFFGIFYGHI